MLVIGRSPGRPRPMQACAALAPRDTLRLSVGYHPSTGAVRGNGQHWQKLGQSAGCMDQDAAWTSSVPAFYLYGEPRRAVDERFVHVEALIDRTRPSEWTIRPHVHPDLNHIFYVGTGGGAMRADAVTLHFAAPCLMLVPAGTVHGFAWGVRLLRLGADVGEQSSAGLPSARPRPSCGVCRARRH